MIFRLQGCDGWGEGRGILFIKSLGGFFFYQLFAGRSAKLRCAGRRSGDTIFHSIGRREIIVFILQNTRVYAPSSELVPPTPSLKVSVSPPLDPKGGEQHSLAGRGVGDPIWTTG